MMTNNGKRMGAKWEQNGRNGRKMGENGSFWMKPSRTLYTKNGREW
jgi:hypothetical protein